MGSPQNPRSVSAADSSDRDPAGPLRVLHVSPSFYPAVEYGGPVASLYELCLAQKRAGLLVRVLTSTAGLGFGLAEGLAGRWVETFGVPTYYAPVRLAPDLAPAMVPQLVRLCRWAQLVHVTGLFSAASVLGVAAALAGELGERVLRFGGFAAPRAVVLSPRGALLPWALATQGRRRKQRFLTVLAPLLRKVHGWHATSEEEATAIQTMLLGLSGAAQPIIQVVVPGLPAASSGESATVAAAPPPRVMPPACQLLVLGRVHPVKNLELAMQALALLRREMPAASLVIAGPEADAAYAAQLRAHAAELGVSAAVSWPGLVTGAAKQKLLAESSVLWLCSHMESFGNVVVESLAAGTPVVATRTTPWQLLEQAAVGRWVPPDPAALAAATVELLSRQTDAAAQQALAARCQELVCSQFSLAQSERQMRRLYHRALGEVGGSGGFGSPSRG